MCYNCHHYNSKIDCIDLQGKIYSTCRRCNTHIITDIPSGYNEDDIKTILRFNMKTEKWGNKYKALQCGKCGNRTVLRPIGICFIDDGVEYFDTLDGKKLPKVLSLKEACNLSDDIHKVCTKCAFGEKIDKEDMHYWFDS